jgi:RNA polymerase sigma factor (sigma-70 family)
VAVAETTTVAAATAVEAATTSAVESLSVRGRPDGAAAGRTAEIFERHGATVLGLCRMLLRNEHEAEDAAQQTFLAAYRSIRNGVDPRHPAAWLATIARNECWAAIERRMREPVHQGELESGLPDPVAQAAANADLEELWRAIGELPRQQRRALLLREFSGLTYAELAAALGVTEPAVESLLVRARRQLRGRLRPLSGSAAALAAPFGALRDAVARLLLGVPDAPAASGLAKLAAGAAAAVVAGGTVTAVETHDVGREVGTPPADAAVALAAVTLPAGSPSMRGPRTRLPG